MREVEYTTRAGVERHKIYERAEAERLGLPYLEDWRDSSEGGQWVLTDDGFVVQILRVGFKGGQLAWVRTCTGSYSRHQRLDTAERECRWTFNGKEPGAPRSRASGAFAVLVAHGMDIADAYLQTHPRAKDRERARLRGLKLFETETVRQIVSEEIGDILQTLKIDKKYVIQRFKDLIEEADSDMVKLNALKFVAELVEVAPKRQPTAGGALLFQGISRDELDRIEAERTASRELPGSYVELDAAEDGA